MKVKASLLVKKVPNRTEFQQLAELRIREAKIAFDNGCFEGAYYLAGYAIECALKACIAKRTRAGDFPRPPNEIGQIYSHKFPDLFRHTDIEAMRDQEMKKNEAFDRNWGVVKDWSEETRYLTSIPESDARELLNAITDTENGVLPWLKKLW